MPRLLAVLIVLGLVLTSPTSALGQAQVEVELFTEPGFPPAETHQWLRAFTDAGITQVRIRARRPGDRVEMVERGTAASPIYSITGMLTARNTVQLPGATFSRNQVGRMADWLDNLKQGPKPPGEEKTVFGMTENQFAALRRDLGQRVAFSTKGERTTSVINRIGRGLRHRISIDPAARAALMEQEEVLDELQGLAYGTALAAIARPAGVVLQPQVEAGQVELVITPGRGRDELWPIGWKPDKPSGQVLPKLVDVIQVEIDDIPVSQALEAITGRLDVPVLFDHNALVRHGVDMDGTTANIPAGRRLYSSILTNILAAARLTYELRTDDADQPFLWITRP